ncbi:hypothetical protein NST28_29230 [Paenibacillus sp. FSL R10-2791]|uniref:hypothetical protein n=1 Tax=unclassified Paenibacillus TaxID=185978 RepID=UPI0030F8AAFE
MKVKIEDINVNGEYKGTLYVESDERQYMLNEYNGKQDKEGRDLYKTHGYFPSVESALQKALKLRISRSTSTTLHELIAEVESIKEEIRTTVTF